MKKLVILFIAFFALSSCSPEAWVFLFPYSVLSYINHVQDESVYVDPKCSDKKSLEHMEYNFYKCDGYIFQKITKNEESGEYVYDHKGSKMRVGFLYYSVLTDGTTILNEKYIKQGNNFIHENAKFFPHESSFQIIAGDYAKDAYNVYFQGGKIPGADVESFRVLEKGYSRDKNAIYTGDLKIIGINLDSFQALNEFYSKDDSAVYFLMGVIEGADLQTFEVLGNKYARDKNSVYYLGQKVHFADPKSIEVLVNKDVHHGDFARDKDSIFFGGQKIYGVDRETFEILAHDYARDKNFVYNGGEKITNAHSKTFVVLNSFFAKDKNSIYYEGTPTKMTTPIDIKNFQSIGMGYYGKDKENIYYLDDDYNFIVLPGVYGLDLGAYGEYFYSNLEVYYAGEKMSGVDRKTFSYNKDFNRYAVDQYSAFYKGKAIPGVHRDSFEVMDDHYAKDKFDVYIQSTRMKRGVDLNTFSVIKYPFSRDKNSVYFWKEKTAFDPETTEVTMEDDQYVVTDKTGTYIYDEEKDEFIKEE